MSKDKTADDDEDRRVRVMRGGGSDSVYGLGMIGAWIYYIGRATTFEERLRGFFKGLVWPAFMVYELFVFLEQKPRPPARRQPRRKPVEE